MQTRFAVGAPRGGLALAAALRHEQYRQSRTRIDAALRRRCDNAIAMHTRYTCPSQTQTWRDLMNIEHVLEPLANIDYPAEREDLLTLARRDGAPTPVLDVLQGLPAQSFNGRYEIRPAATLTIV